MLQQLSYQAHWEQAIMWVIYKPVDAEIADRWDLYSHSYRQDHPLTHFLICCPAETEAWALESGNDTPEIEMYPNKSKVR